MTIFHHTPINDGDSNNASTVNTPLGALDAAIGALATLTTTNKSSVAAALGTTSLPTYTATTYSAFLSALANEVINARGGYANVDARLDAFSLTGGGGAAYTQVNGAHTAPDTTITVDDTSNFVTGMYVTIQHTAGDFGEYQVTVDSGTQFTISPTLAANVSDNAPVTYLPDWAKEMANAILSNQSPLPSDAMNWAGMDTYNALAYGVTPAKTAAQNTTALDALEAVIGSAGGVVYFPPGTYLVEDFQCAAPNVWFVGAGPKSIIKRDSGAITGNACVRIISGGDGCAFMNLGFDGDGYAQRFMRITSANGVRIQNCYFTNIAEAAIAIQGSASYIQITDNYFVDGAAGFIDGVITDAAVTGTHFIITHNRFSQSRVGVSINAPTSGTSMITISDNVIEGDFALGAAADRYGISLSTGDHVMIANNVIKGSPGDGIHIEGNCNNLTIVDNIVEGCGEPGIDFSGAAATTQENVIIRGNICSGNGQDGIELAGSSPNYINFVISDNICYDNTTHGIQIIDLQNSVVADNICYDNNDTGLQLTGCTDVSVIGNRCYDTGVATQVTGLTISTDTNVIARDNICHGNTTTQYDYNPLTDRVGQDLSALILNPSFEETDALLNSWTATGSLGVGGAEAQEGTTTYEGGYSYNLTTGSSGTTRRFYQHISSEKLGLRTGDKLTLYCYRKSTSTGGRVALEFYQADKSTQVGSTTNGSVGTDTTNWERVTASAAVPSGSVAFVRLIVEPYVSVSASTDIYVDSVGLLKA